MCKGFDRYVSTNLRCSTDIFFQMRYGFTKAPILICSKIFHAVTGFAIWVYMTNSL